MSKVLIDRELLERAVYGLELAYETDTPTVRDICAVLAAPSGTPAMPVKAYYHERTDLEGVRTRSVGLEVRKEFTDAPLVLEADARARIAEIEADRDSHQRCAIQAMAELSALKAQEPVAWYTEDHLDDKSATTYSKELADRWVAKGWPVNGIANAADAQAIIDGLRGEVAEQEETANQWRELALQFDRHRMTAMAHIRAAASGDKSAIEALGVFAALPPIPGHEITAARDQHAQRIGELETALEFACKSLAQVTSSDGSGHADIAVSVLRMAGTKDADALHVVEAYKAGAKWRIDAALSAGKEGE